MLMWQKIFIVTTASSAATGCVQVNSPLFPPMSPPIVLGPVGMPCLASPQSPPERMPVATPGEPLPELPSFVVPRLEPESGRGGGRVRRSYAGL